MMQFLPWLFGREANSMRNVLPQRRRAETIEMQHGGQNNTFQVTIGYYADGSIGEVFVSGAKAGSNVDALCRDAAIMLSLALQHGTPLDLMKHAITREGDGAPSTIIGAVVDKLTNKGGR
jgi:hypothetical protein